MSVQYGVICLDCMAPSPRVGDGGFLGAPSLRADTGAYKYVPDMPTFGYLYEPLRLLGLQSYELESFASFLRRHADHGLFLHSDHDDSTHYPADVKAKQDALEERDYSRDEQEAEERIEKESVATGAFVDAYYALHCSHCAVTYASSDTGRFRAFTTLPVPREAVQLFIDRWDGLSPDGGWNHRLTPPLDPFEPFLEHLPEFVKQHQGHSLVARLSRTPIVDGLTGERIKERRHQRQQDEQQARSEAHARAVSALSRGEGYGHYLTRLLAAWVVVDVVPLVCFVATRPSVTRSAQVAVFSTVVIVPSLVWTLLGARFAWDTLDRYYSRTIGRGISFALRALALSWATWALFNTFGPRLPPLWALMAVTIEWLHAWMIPSTLILGALAGHLQWSAFHSMLYETSAGNCEDYGVVEDGR